MPMNARILVVEDDQHFSGILRDYLEYEGFEVECASDGNEALQKVEGTAPHLVLADVLLPRLSGLELCAHVQAHPDVSVPVVLMSAVYKDADTVASLLRQCGAQDFLVKPFAMDDLKSRLLAALPDGLFSERPGATAHDGEGGALVLLDNRLVPLASEGSVEPGALASLLLAILAHSHTGVLSFRDGKRWKQIVFLNGYPVWADGGGNADRLGTMLLEEGTIDPEQFACAVQSMRDEGIDFGSALTRHGILSPTELYAQLRRLVERRAVSAFEWTVGNWSLSDEFPPQTTPFEVQPLVVVWKGLKDHGDVASLAALLEPHWNSFAIPTGRFAVNWATLKTQEGIGVLGGFLSGRRTPADLLQLGLLERDDLVLSLALLYLSGMVGFGAHPATASRMAGVASESSGPSTVDVPSLTGTLTDQGEQVIQDYLRLWHADFFTIFKIPPGASDERVGQCLSRDVLSWEPDELPESLPGDLRAKANALAAHIAEGRRVLGDPTTRSAYQRECAARSLETGNAPQAALAEAAMFFEMGKSFVQKKDFREAELAFGKAVERDPESAEYVAYRGWATYRRGAGSEHSVSKACALLERALVLDDHLPTTHYFMGMIHR
ncbi:MAG: hypothetical protein CL928_16455, partial [Deltaproteobacteria bacterium]|nr:hypothetical protein [Deltaproteobacteria bacterium]